MKKNVDQIESGVTFTERILTNTYLKKHGNCYITEDVTRDWKNSQNNCWEKKDKWVSVNGKRTGMVKLFVLIHERSIKEWTRATANRRGSPLKD